MFEAPVFNSTGRQVKVTTEESIAIQLEKVNKHSFYSSYCSWVSFLYTFWNRTLYLYVLTYLIMLFFCSQLFSDRIYDTIYMLLAHYDHQIKHPNSNSPATHVALLDLFLCQCWCLQTVLDWHLSLSWVGAEYLKQYTVDWTLPSQHGIHTNPFLLIHDVRLSFWPSLHTFNPVTLSP